MNRVKKCDKKTTCRSIDAETNRRYTDNEQGWQSGMELTRDGWLFCAAAGIMETISALAVFSIDLLHVPLLVFLVLWAAFGILTSVFLLGTGYYLVSYRSMKANMCAAVKQEIYLLPEQRNVWDVKKAS